MLMLRLWIEATPCRRPVWRRPTTPGKNLRWTLEEVPAADELHQWAVLRTASAPDTRPFDYYVDF